MLLLLLANAAWLCSPVVSLLLTELSTSDMTRSVCNRRIGISGPVNIERSMQIWLWTSMNCI